MPRRSANPHVPATIAARALVYLILLGAALFAIGQNGLLFPVALVTFAVAAALGWKARHDRPPPDGAFCPTCGYDCRATPDRCPECGNIPPR